MDTAVVLFIGAALLVLVLSLYFWPAIHANKVGHPDQTPILILNLMLGWMLIPWVIALVWAHKGNHQRQHWQVEDVNERMEPPGATLDKRDDDWLSKRCPYCAETILAAAIKCKHCGSVLVEDALTIGD
jgi:hypothetical protein